MEATSFEYYQYCKVHIEILFYYMSASVVQYDFKRIKLNEDDRESNKIVNSPLQNNIEEKSYSVVNQKLNLSIENCRRLGGRFKVLTKS